MHHLLSLGPRWVVVVGGAKKGRGRRAQRILGAVRIPRMMVDACHYPSVQTHRM